MQEGKWPRGPALLILCKKKKNSRKEENPEGQVEKRNGLLRLPGSATADVKSCII